MYSPPPPEDPHRSWRRALRFLSRQIARFEENEIDVEALKRALNTDAVLLDRWLVELGVTAIAHRAVIFKQLQWSPVEPVDPGCEAVLSVCDKGTFFLPSISLSFC